MEIYSERIAWALKTIEEDKDVGRGIKTLELAKQLGIDYKTLTKYKLGGGSLKSESINVLILNYKFNPLWLFKGQGEPFPGARAKYPEVCGPEEVTVPAVLPDDKKGDYVFVPQVSDQISAGGGFIPHNQVEMQIAFRKSWIQKKGDPENMSLIKVSGDSMEPTLISGDLVLVDHNRDYIDPQGGIYAIALDNTIMIKRLQPTYQDQKVRIISDNDRYDTIDTDIDQVKINGKVIWYAREIER